MDYKRFSETIYARFNRGDEITSGIMDICKKEKILSATYTRTAAGIVMQIPLRKKQ